jgi:plastocyanin
MIGKGTFSLLTATVAAVAVSGIASAAPASRASVVIRHQTHGCHAWSVNGGAYKATQAITLRGGATLSVTNNDVMPHTLVQTSGPAVVIPNAKMGHMSATTKVVFSHAGTYRFTTKPGEDYMSGVKTTGPDNVLRLTVKVVG